jgi:LysM repeat protein
MLKKFIFILFSAILLNPLGFAKIPTKSLQEIVNELATEIDVIRNEIKNLTAEVHNNQKDIELLKLSANTLSEFQTDQVKKLAEESYKQYNVVEIVDQRTNTLSQAFSQEFNTLNEKIRSVFNRIIAAIDAQYKLSNTTALGSELKTPSVGIAYEVKAGETLDSLATKFKVTRDSIKNTNFIMDDCLPAGQMLFIPHAK